MTQIDNSILDGLGLGQSHAQDAKANDKLGQGDFLKLMIAQLRNQDPFKPMESGEFLGQLAQFGTVSGIDEMKTALTGLADSFSANQSLHAASLVDRSVLVRSREAWLPPEGTIRGAIDVPAGTSNTVVEMYDLNGRLVRTLPVEPNENGRAEFEWDGTMADGTPAGPGFYELRGAGDIEGKSTALEVLVAGRVESVGMGGGSVSLTVTGLGVVDFARVRGIG